MRFITQVNKWSGKIFGWTRPLWEGAAGAGAAYGIGKWVPILRHPAALIGSGVATAAVTESVLFFAGNDEDVWAEDFAYDVDDMINVYCASDPPSRAAIEKGLFASKSPQAEELVFALRGAAEELAKKAKAG